MGQEVLAASVADAGALIAFERGDARLRALLRERRGELIIPATVIAQVWRGRPRQARLAALLASAAVRVEPLDAFAARAVGVLLARSGGADVVDGHVVLAARRHRAIVLTGDARDLRRIDPHVATWEL